MIDKTIGVYLGVNTLPTIVECTEGDTMWRWHFEVYFNSQRWTIPSGGTVMFTGKKADGNVFDMLETIENNEAVVVCDEQMTAAVGPAACVLRFLDTEGKTVASTPIVLAVKPNPQTQGPMSETVLSAYNDVLQLLGDAIDMPAKVTEWLDEHITQETGYVLDTSLTIAGAAADAKATGDAIDDLRGTIETLETIPTEVKRAMDTLFSKAAYADDDAASSYATFHAWATANHLTSISAAYTQSGEVYTDDDLDSLKGDLVVTATYSDSTTAVIPAADYTLTGTLAEGTSTITVSYGGKTTTFDVTITAPLYSIPDFAEQSLTAASGTSYIKKENGVYYYRGRYTDVMYIYPDGTVNKTKSNTLWFATPGLKPIEWKVYDIDWVNPNTGPLDLACKFSQPNATGNLATAQFTMGAQSSGTDDEASFTNAEYSAHDFSALGVQVYKSGNRSEDVTVSFRCKLFCDGVRYL